jgi:chromate transporter
LGLTAYGAVMLQELRSSFLKRGWITEKEFEEGLGMVQLYPGPVMYNLATYVAYRIIFELLLYIFGIRFF